jgi:hypothetical protein
MTLADRLAELRALAESELHPDAYAYDTARKLARAVLALTGFAGAIERSETIAELTVEITQAALNALDRALAKEET